MTKAIAQCPTRLTNAFSKKWENHELMFARAHGRLILPLLY